MAISPKRKNKNQNRSVRSNSLSLDRTGKLPEESNSTTPKTPIQARRSLKAKSTGKKRTVNLRDDSNASSVSSEKTHANFPKFSKEVKEYNDELENFTEQVKQFDSQPPLDTNKTLRSISELQKIIDSHQPYVKSPKKTKNQYGTSKFKITERYLHEVLPKISPKLAVKKNSRRIKSAQKSSSSVASKVPSGKYVRRSSRSGSTTPYLRSKREVRRKISEGSKPKSTTLWKIEPSNIVKPHLVLPIPTTNRTSVSTVEPESESDEASDSESELSPSESKTSTQDQEQEELEQDSEDDDFENLITPLKPKDKSSKHLDMLVD